MNKTEIKDEKKEIKKLEGTGKIEVTGFSGNDGMYGRSYLIFTKDEQVYSLNGFGAKQFEDYEDKLFNRNFDLYYETKTSKTYNKDYIVISKIVAKKKRDVVNFVDEGEDQ